MLVPFVVMGGLGVSAVLGDIRNICQLLHSILG
jgi:hypothetical protein